MTRSDLVSTIAQILEPWAWEIESWNATIARDDATAKAEQILAALALPAPVVEGDAHLRAALDRAASRLVQCAHHANVCGDTVHQVWDQWAKEARAALSEGRSHG